MVTAAGLREEVKVQGISLTKQEDGERTSLEAPTLCAKGRTAKGLKNTGGKKGKR